VLFGMSIYRVTGSLKYRGHRPGTVFIASLTPEEEGRAVMRHNIEVIQRGPVQLDDSKIRPPKG